MIETVKRVVCDYCGQECCAALPGEDCEQIAEDYGWYVSDDHETHYCVACARKKGL